MKGLLSKAVMLSRSIQIASEAFVDKFDKGGYPYIIHCLCVMHAVGPDDFELMVIAVLHDLIEDTDWTIDDLIREGFSKRVTDALRLLTHEDDIEYDDYIRALAKNEDSKKVKRADLRHNSDIMRMKGLREKDHRRMEKYHRAFEYLKD